MQRTKPTVVDEEDFAQQLEALIDAADEGDVHPALVSDELAARARQIEAERWGEADE